MRIILMIIQAKCTTLSPVYVKLWTPASPENPPPAVGFPPACSSSEPSWAGWMPAAGTAPECM